jgi:hypothetical protein
MTYHYCLVVRIFRSYGFAFRNNDERIVDTFFVQNICDGLI